MRFPVSDTLPLPAYWIDKLRNTPQNPRYHAEGSVLDHVFMVMDQYRCLLASGGLPQAEAEVLFWAVVLHDIGKPAVTRFVDGAWKAWGHESAGVPVARELLAAQPQLSPRQRRQVLELVFFHNLPLSLGLKKSAIDAYRPYAMVTDLRLLGQFAELDLKGRICEDPDRILGIIEEFRQVIEPRIRFETGSFEDLEAGYAASSLQKQHALWSTWRRGDMTLLGKLLQSGDPGQSAQKPPFRLWLAIGNAGLLSDPEYLELAVGKQTLSLFDLDDTEANRRMTQHFISVFGAMARKNLVIAGECAQETARWQIIDYARSLGGAVEIVAFEKPYDMGMGPVWPLHTVVHPWEASTLRRVHP